MGMNEYSFRYPFYIKPIYSISDIMDFGYESFSYPRGDAVKSVPRYVQTSKITVQGYHNVPGFPIHSTDPMP
jgi:hypothetical protein